MKRYALTSEQGTAAPETTLCISHFTEENKITATKQAWDDIKNFGFVDVSLNDACKCIICGN